MVNSGDEDDPFPADDCLFAETFSQETVYRLLGEELKIRQLFGANLGVAAPVWEAALHLCCYFEEQAVEVRGKRVIELGAGTGVVGILAARLGAVVTLTDLPLALSQLQANVSDNTPSSGWPASVPTVLPLSWDQKMEFWSENQGQYSKFGTIPGRHYTHNYHDRHQTAQYPLYYGEQQDQGRESSYWTLPGSRTGGAPQEYTNWTDQELTAPASSHFPFIIDRHPQQHQDLGYQPHEARDREWIAAHRATREYERGYLREGGQRRWEQCSPVQYNREVSTKRSDSSYRELEAWAARYSHSLPRRRRIEAELRGASQGLLEGSRAPERDSRSGRDPRLTALQQVLQSANIRESGLWDRGSRQQTPTYYPSQTPATDTSHVLLDTKENTGYQRRMFSQPPGYIAPPPYNSPHKSSPVLHHSDTSWEQEGKRQTNWSQHTPSKQNVSLTKSRDDFTKPDTFPELEGLNLQRQETTVSHASSPISIQIPHTPREDTLSPQQPQVLQAVENVKINEEPSTKVIEGRKFRLNKKTGGMTIFCLVSRIAGTTETPSLPLCALQTNTELGGDINQTHKLADEVDYRVPKLTEQSDTFHARNLKAQQETPICVENKLPEGNLSNEAETQASTNHADSTSGRQVAQSVQPVSVKYPLWREPSFTSRAETESSSTCLEVNNHEGDALRNQEVSAEVQPIDIEVRRLDIKEDTESEETLLVVNTTCVAKMELVPPPKKEHVHYADPKPHDEDSPLDIQSSTSPECVQSNDQLNQDVTIDQNAGTDLLNINERPETEPDSYLMGKRALEEESEITFPSMSSSAVSQRETLEERAERILGIPLHDCIIEQKHEDASCVEDQEGEASPVKDNDTDDAAEKPPEETTEEEQLQSQSEDAWCLQEKSDAEDQVVKEGGEDFAGSREQMSTMSEGNDTDSQLETDIKASPETETPEDPLLKSAGEEPTEQSQEENEPVENDSSSRHHSQCLSPPTDLSDSSSLYPDCEAANPALSHMLFYISESNFTDGPDPELIALSSTEASHPETPSLPHTPSQQLLSPLHPESGDFTDRSPSPSSLDLMDQTAEAVSGIEYQDEVGETSELTNDMLSDVPEDLATEELASQQLQPPLPGGSADLVHFSIPDRDRSPSPSPLELVDQTVEPVSSVEDQDEEGETSQLINNEIGDPTDLCTDMTEELVSHQQYDDGQLECIHAEDVVCVKMTYMTEEELSEELSEDSIDSSEISNEDPTEVNSLRQQPKSYITEEQLPNETGEDPTDRLQQTISQENVTEGQIQTEVNVSQQSECIQAEDVVCLKKTYMTEEELSEEVDEEATDQIQTPGISEEGAREVNSLQQQLESYMTEEQLPNEANEDSTDQIQTPEISKGDAIEVNSLQQHFESYMTEEQLPNETDEDPTDLLEHTISQENVTQRQTEANILQQRSNHVQEEDAVSDLPFKEEPQYPQSLWDAVNRIRKHTAPDSETEEEDVSELWDPENVGEDLDSEKIVFDEAGQQVLLTEGGDEDAEVGQIQQDACHEESSGYAEEDTLSCSSASSHHSGDTVILADDDEVDEMPPDADRKTESEGENDEDFQMAEGERCCSGQVKDETAPKEEEDGDESVTNESSKTDESPVEMANTTTEAVEVMETEQEENKNKVFTPLEVSDTRMTESESVK
ncbi:EEF1A lysine methyltransferase 3 [Nibea albiflora]|uniref:EEF1A lysine methyltransferase 3 n=1 Tax=Nibea albiflora TaxID=240163 RepID=A0ACB7F0H6_NIBAL|nr:EEF1A lysine methyltransferase 3 [Nibea albiflora]